MQKIVEFNKSSSIAHYMLIEYQKILELPMHKVLQENNARWWSILIMMDRIIEQFESIIIVVGLCNKNI